MPDWQASLELLGLQCQQPTVQEITKAHRRLSLLAHPDKRGGSVERQQAINQAKDLLLTPQNLNLEPQSWPWPWPVPQTNSAPAPDPKPPAITQLEPLQKLHVLLAELLEAAKDRTNAEGRIRRLEEFFGAKMKLVSCTNFMRTQGHGDPALRQAYAKEIAGATAEVLTEAFIELRQALIDPQSMSDWTIDCTVCGKTCFRGVGVLLGRNQCRTCANQRANKKRTRSALEAHK